VDLEVQVRWCLLGVAAVSDVAERLSSVNDAPVDREARIAREMGVVELVSCAVREPESVSAQSLPADGEDDSSVTASTGLPLAAKRSSP
jgi:hypothetical protein